MKFRRFIDSENFQKGTRRRKLEKLHRIQSERILIRAIRYRISEIIFVHILRLLGLKAVQFMWMGFVIKQLAK